MAYETNGEVPYTAIEYGEGEGTEAVALVAGFFDDTDTLEQAAKDLVHSGRDAVVYNYHPRVLMAGDGELLPDFIDTLSGDFEGRTGEYAAHRFGGVSLGGAIAANMQKKYDAPKRGIYAATGVDAAHLVFGNQIFRAVMFATQHVDIRRTYEKNGYTETDLRERWKDVQALPDNSPITIALGGLDYIVQSREMISRVRKWRAENHDVRVIYKPLRGHTGMIKWFNTHINTMLETDESI